MIYTPLLQKAFLYAIQVHEFDQQQKRKGKDVPYFTHPIQVGHILAKAGARDEVIAAGFLHDTIEDSVKEHKVTYEMLVEEFGPETADLVNAVTEKDKGLSWEERKELALEEISHFSPEAVMVKSGDVISNVNELMSDYQKDGPTTFLRFNASSSELIHHSQEVVNTLMSAWPENPLLADLQICKTYLETMK